MTSHQFAAQLLAGKDLPILIPKVIQYDDSEDCCTDPFVVEEDGETRDGDPCRVLIIDTKITPDSARESSPGISVSPPNEAESAPIPPLPVSTGEK